MDTFFLILGIVCILSAVIGSGIEIWIIRFPPTIPLKRQIYLGIIGIIFVILSYRNDIILLIRTQPSDPVTKQANDTHSAQNRMINIKTISKEENFEELEVIGNFFQPAKFSPITIKKYTDTSIFGIDSLVFLQNEKFLGYLKGTTIDLLSICRTKGGLDSFFYYSWQGTATTPGDYNVAFFDPLTGILETEYLATGEQINLEEDFIHCGFKQISDWKENEWFYPCNCTYEEKVNEIKKATLLYEKIKPYEHISVLKEPLAFRKLPYSNSIINNWVEAAKSVSIQEQASNDIWKIEAIAFNQDYFPHVVLLATKLQNESVYSIAGVSGFLENLQLEANNVVFSVIERYSKYTHTLDLTTGIYTTEEGWE